MKPNNVAGYILVISLCLIAFGLLIRLLQKINPDFMLTLGSIGILTSGAWMLYKKMKGSQES